uniref:Immunoglobulin C1-set domain-containing protein n=1 Tax=Sinocyclocheilus rhinocerous TaxID=307959 RepID=A0A673IL66_9TELE
MAGATLPRSESESVILLNSPDVRVFARKAPDDHSKLVLICLATGFYPRDIEMYIRLNRINIESQISSGIRPNADETFQMRSSVKIDSKDKVSYDCLVIHSSLTEPVCDLLLHLQKEKVKW